MNKINPKLIVPIVVAGLLVFTNPSVDDHRDSFKELAIEIIQENMKEFQSESEYPELDEGVNALISGFGSMIVNSIADTLIYRDNYLFVSTTKIKVDGESRVIGFGILGNVLLPKDRIKESINQAKEEL